MKTRFAWVSTYCCTRCLTNRWRRFAALALCLALAYAPAFAETIAGRVITEAGAPVPGAVVYVLDQRHALRVFNNTAMKAEALPKALTNREGEFSLNLPEDADAEALIVRDIEDHYALYTGSVTARVEIQMPKPARLNGVALNGPTPIAGRMVTGILTEERLPLQYILEIPTGQDGRFEFPVVVPGRYTFRIVEEVPQVGCCFRSVVTKAAMAEVRPGEATEVRLGGTDMPYLTGAVADTTGQGLQGVWVSLRPAFGPEEAVLSAITDRQGRYAIFDIPPSEYSLRCFRRLALNNARRTLEAMRPVTISADAAPDPDFRLVRNECNVAVDLAPFLPLEFGATAPPLSGQLAGGGDFSLDELRGKVVVVHFYASWCRTCHDTVAFYDQLLAELDSPELACVGVDLDASLEECRRFIAEKGMRHPQIYAGPWPDSAIRKAYHVQDVPTTFIIGRDGAIAETDFFNEPLKAAVEARLRHRSR